MPDRVDELVAKVPTDLAARNAWWLALSDEQRREQTAADTAHMRRRDGYYSVMGSEISWWSAVRSRIVASTRRTAASGCVKRTAPRARGAGRPARRAASSSTTSGADPGDPEPAFSPPGLRLRRTKYGLSPNLLGILLHADVEGPRS